jgi:DNA-binding response OmpR family regulator
MTAESLQIILVEDNEGDVRLLQEILSEVDNNIELNLIHAACLGEAVEKLTTPNFDLILLDLMLPDSFGLDTLTRMQGAAPDLPIIVLTGIGDEALAVQAVQSGAQDYLIKGEISSRLLIRSIRYAIARQRQLVEREREIRVLERLTHPPKATITAQTFGLKRLSENLPATFNDLVDQYGQLLDQVLEERAYKIEQHVADRLRTLSEQLGFLKAGPRDVIELHITTLKKKSKNAPSKIAQAYVEEGRLQVLELMGYLTSYYLNRSLALTRFSPPLKPTDLDQNRS